MKKAQKKYHFGYLYHPRTKWMRKYIEWRKRQEYKMQALLNKRPGYVVSGHTWPASKSGECVMGKSEFERLKKILNARPKDGLFANVVFVNEADIIPVAIKNLRNN